MKRSHPRTDMARALRDTGLTYREIAEKMGISHQRVAAMCGKENPKYFRILSDSLVYPNLRKWLNTNKVSISELMRRCGDIPGGQQHSLYRDWLYGRSDPSKRIIDACIKVTGMKYEELFYRE